MAIITLRIIPSREEPSLISAALVIDDGGTVTGLGATSAKAGLVKQGAAVADAAGAAPTAAEFKAPLDSLRTAGIIAAS